MHPYDQLFPNHCLIYRSENVVCCRSVVSVFGYVKCVFDSTSILTFCCLTSCFCVQSIDYFVWLNPPIVLIYYYFANCVSTYSLVPKPNILPKLPRFPSVVAARLAAFASAVESALLLLLQKLFPLR
jgi:hypothetical protein